MLEMKMLSEAGKRARAKAQKKLKSDGFSRIRSNVWVGRRNDKAISGIIIDGPLNHLKFSLFVIPSFGDYKYISLSFSKYDEPFDEKNLEDSYNAVYKSYKLDMFNVCDTAGLLKIYESLKIDSIARVLVTAMCLFEMHKFEECRELLDRYMCHIHDPDRQQQMSIMKHVCINGDDLLADKFIKEWTLGTSKLLGAGDYALPDAVK